MKFKVFSKKELLAATLATALFMTACSSAKTTEQTTEDTVITEAVTTTEATAEETTAATEATTEEPAETQAEDKIVLLLDEINVGKLKDDSFVAQLFDLDSYPFFMMACFKETDKSSDYDCGLNYWGNYGHSFKINTLPDDGSKSYDAEIYFTYDNFYEETGDIVIDHNSNADSFTAILYYEIDGKTGDLLSFAPVFYNQAKGCMAGYKANEDLTEFSWVELYYSPASGELVEVPADIAEYGI